MSRIDEYEQILRDLESRLDEQCRELRAQLDSVYDRDPTEALQTTQALAEVFRKLKVLKDRGEVFRRALDALREMERLKAAIMDQVAELGPEYTKYRMARSELAGDGEQELQAPFQEDEESFRLDYVELEGAPIGPFRALDPVAFEEAGRYEDDDASGAPATAFAASVEPAAPPPLGIDAPESAPVSAAAVAGLAMAGPTSVVEATAPVPEEPPAPDPEAVPFSTAGSFEEEGGDALADTWVGDRSELQVPPVDQSAVDTPVPGEADAGRPVEGGASGVQLADPVAIPQTDAPSTTSAELAVEDEDLGSPAASGDDDPDPVDAMRQVFGDQGAGAPFGDPEPTASLGGEGGLSEAELDAALDTSAADPTRSTVPGGGDGGDPAQADTFVPTTSEVAAGGDAPGAVPDPSGATESEAGALGSTAADLLSMMDDDEDEEFALPDPVLAGHGTDGSPAGSEDPAVAVTPIPGTPPAPPVGEDPETPGEIAGSNAASLLAALDEDEDDLLPSAGFETADALDGPTEEASPTGGLSPFAGAPESSAVPASGGALGGFGGPDTTGVDMPDPFGLDGLGAPPHPGEVPAPAAAASDPTAGGVLDSTDPTGAPLPVVPGTPGEPALTLDESTPDSPGPPVLGAPFEDPTTPTAAGPAGALSPAAEPVSGAILPDPAGEPPSPGMELDDLDFMDTPGAGTDAGGRDFGLDDPFGDLGGGPPAASSPDSPAPGSAEEKDPLDDF